MPRTSVTTPNKNTRAFAATPDAFDGETNIGMDRFPRELDLKLRQLQCKRSTTSCSNAAELASGNNIDSLLTIAGKKRPLFVTTVPTGVFLQPGPVKKISPRRAYAFYSVPRILIGISTTHALAAKVPQATTVSGCKLPREIPKPNRIARGSNFNHQPPFNCATGAGSGDGIVGDAETRRRQQLCRKLTARNAQRGIIGTPPPVTGRKHEDVQTDQYLEELFARPPEYDRECQTDLFLQRPATPPFVPAKVGVDMATEILDGELFDFDAEVEPVLATLVGRAVEQGLLEVQHEEELADLRQQQQHFLAVREMELAELRRLEAEETRLQAEKKRRLEQERIGRDLDAELQERVTAAKLLQAHVSDLLPGVIQSIDPYLDVENREQLERQLGPWLANEVAEEVGQMIDSRVLLEELVRQILVERGARYMQMSKFEYQVSEPSIDEEMAEEELEEQTHKPI